MMRELRVYRFHAVFYAVATALGLLVVALMSLSPGLDWWIDDGAVYLWLIFGISGAVLCVALAPAVWWLKRRPVLTKSVLAGCTIINALTLVPYALIAGILLFYRE